MKEGWERKTVGEVAEVISGQSPASKFYNKSNEGLPFYQGKKLFTDRYINVPDTWTTEVTRKAQDGDILMSVRAPVGPVNFATQEICIGRGLAAIRSSKELNKDYLFNFFLKHESEIVGNSGAVFNSINRKQIEAISIPVPPLAEQEAIVEVLDKAFAAIDQAKANIEQNIANAKELFQSKLNQIFSQKGEGWVRKSLGSITGGVSTGPFGSLLHKSDYIEGGTPLVNPAHITEVGIEPDYSKTVTEETASRLHNYQLSEDDIVIGRRGEMGRCAVVTENEDGWLCGTGSFIIRHSPRIKSEYLVRFLRSHSTREKLEAIASGAVMKNLSNSSLSNFVIDIPPIETQEAILSQFNNLCSVGRQLESQYQTKLTSLDELKKSILQKAFAGELT